MSGRKSKSKSSYFELLAIVFVAVLIVSNIASVKIVDIAGFIFDAGTVLFPISYIIGDIITEIYGFARMRKLIFRTGAILLGVALTFWLIGLLPSASLEVQTAYDQILGVVWRIVIASIVAFTVGELINAYVLEYLKTKDKGKYLWKRLIGSSVFGNAVDTMTFSVIAFFGTMANSELVVLIGTVFVMKLSFEIAISPLTIKLIRIIQAREASVLK